MLLDDEMAVGAAGAERADARQTRQFHAHAVAFDRRPVPCAEFALHPERAVLEIDVGIEHVRMDRRHQRAMPHLQQHLGEAGDARGRFQMTKVGFGRTDRAVLEFRLRKRLGQACDLDGIAQRGARAVRLDIAEVARVHAGGDQRFLDQRRLTFGIGYGEAGGLAAVVDRGPADHAVDVIAVGDRLRQRLEQHRAHALARHVAVAALAEGAAAAVGGQEMHVRQQVVLVRMQRQVHRTGDGRVDLAAADRLAGEMDRGDRGRARRVDGDAGPGEIEIVRDAIGDRPIVGVRCCPRLLRAIHAVQLVIAPHQTDVHADRVVAHRLRRHQRLRRIAGILDRQRGDLQEQALVRVEVLRFLRRDVEEHRIEMIDVAQEPAPLAVAARRCGRAGLEAELHRDIRTRLRDRLHAVAAQAQVVPERLQRFGLRIAAGQTDDGDLLVHARGAGIALGRDRAHRISSGAHHRGVPRSGRLDGSGDRHGGACGVARMHDAAAVRRVVFDEIPDEIAQVLVLEEQRFRQRPEGFFHVRDEIDHHHRVEAVLLEGTVFLELRRDAQLPAEQLGQVTPHRRAPRDRVLAIGIRDGHSHRRHRAPGGDAQDLVHLGCVARHHHDLRARLRQRVLQHVDAFSGQQRHDAEAAAQRLLFLVVEAHAAVFPVRPVDRHRPARRLARDAARFARMRERILEGIAESVIALPHVTQHAGDRGEQHEQFQRLVAGLDVQVPRAQCLGRDHAREGLGRLAQQEVVFDHAGRMQHAVQALAVRVDRGDGATHLVAVRDIARQIHGTAAERGQFRQHRTLRVRRRGTPGEIHGCGVARAQMAGDDQAQRAHAAGDQVGPALAERSERCIGDGRQRGGSDRRERPHFAYAVAIAHVGGRVGRGQLIGEDRRQRRGVGQVQLHHAPGEARLLDAQRLVEAAQADRVRRRPCTGRTRRQMHETRGFRAGKQCLDQRERAVRAERDPLGGRQVRIRRRDRHDAVQRHAGRLPRRDGRLAVVRHACAYAQGVARGGGVRGHVVRGDGVVGAQVQPRHARRGEARRSAQCANQAFDIVGHAHQQQPGRRFAGCRQGPGHPQRCIQAIGHRHRRPANRLWRIDSGAGRHRQVVDLRPDAEPPECQANAADAVVRAGLDEVDVDFRDGIGAGVPGRRAHPGVHIGQRCRPGRHQVAVHLQAVQRERQRRRVWALAAIGLDAGDEGDGRLQRGIGDARVQDEIALPGRQVARQRDPRQALASAHAQLRERAMRGPVTQAQRGETAIARIGGDLALRAVARDRGHVQ